MKEVKEDVVHGSMEPGCAGPGQSVLRGDACRELPLGMINNRVIVTCVVDARGIFGTETLN
jgi:hypothetical protein